MIEKASIKSNLSQAKPILPQTHSSYNLPALFLEKMDILIELGRFQTRNEFLRMAVREKLEYYFPELIEKTANVSFTTGPPKSASNPSNSLDKARRRRPSTRTSLIKIDCPRYGRIRKAQCPKLIRTADCEKCKHNPSKKADKGCYNCLHYQSDLCADCNDDFSNWAPQDEDTQGAGIERKLEAPE